MLYKEKFIVYNFSNSNLIQFFAIVFIFVETIFQCAVSEDCVYESPCQCVFPNGSVIDLSSLGDKHNKARFENLSPQNNESYTYYYNPCFSFKLGPDKSDCAKGVGVAVCQVSKDGKNYYDCGDQDSVLFTTTNDVLQIIYKSSPRTTNVTLVCSSEANEAELKVKGESKTKQNLYEMTLTTRCACPDLCRTDHLSTGSVLVILFMIFVALYLVLGIIHSSLTRGAHGWELIPHYEFWSDFPLLVRDGCVFVINGCKPETAYERI